MKNTFEISAKPGEKFIYKIGSVSTNNMWRKPNYLDIQNLTYSIRKLQNYEKYELFLVGGIVNGGIGKTTDIDLVINGPLDFEIESFFYDLYSLGFSKNLLLDIKWLDKKPMNTKEEIIYKCVQFGYVYKQIGDMVSEINLSDGLKISEHLILREIKFPNEKTKKLDNVKYVRI